jgi:hypothetical protein
MSYKNLIIRLLLITFLTGFTQTTLASENIELLGHQTQLELDNSVSKIVNNIYTEINTTNIWSYPDTGTVYNTASEHWKVENQKFFLNEDIQLTQAINNIFKSETQLDCGAAQDFVSLRLYMILLGEENFNALMEINGDNDLANISYKYRRIFDPLDRIRRLQNISIYFGYIKNHELYTKIYDGFYKGYNIVRLSDGMFQGFGTFFSEPRSYKEIRDMFYDQFRKDPTKKNIVPVCLEELEEIRKNRYSFDAYFNLCNFNIYSDVKIFDSCLDGENNMWKNMEKNIDQKGLKEHIRMSTSAGSHKISLDVLNNLVMRSQNQ